MRLFAYVLGLALLCCQTAQAQVRSYDQMIAAGEIKVAVYKDFAPYSFQDGDTPRGVDVELAQALAKAMGVQLTLIWAPAGEKLDDDLRDYIWRGSQLHNQQLADLMMRAPYDRNYAQKRNDQGELENGHVVMFGPYQNEQWQVAYDRRRLDKVASVAVFEQHPIGVEVDSVPSFYLTSVFNGMLAAKTHHYPDVPQAFAAMKAGEVDAVMAMRGEIDWQVHEAHDPQLALAENAYPNMGKQRWEIGMAVHESNRQLAYAVEEALEGLIRDGSVQGIYSHYGLQYEVPEMYQ
ncbi:transporter substrate-binding domain-containing protein [Pseudomonas extremaustralis]|jgi:ABC-type amino acid transport substrate-binding protein|uniref:Amino acid ABC transporter substrate-binding protein, PAAT family n=1 Tax=Pseudomonas extremaustralis TaxID=359110 RepID=A0A5C5QLB4_9PSED|nr:transporter substrate-binding domain-containing protein [Pseudomonas extremaustralis]EZI28050.1 amino acid ABC transporter substrate-binding protein [Pseudomonas extremaustralis 14-3 substr. 14-3b]MDB1108493.1 transporter substrate-binding domain-containing protein [Pseudomonas extremaustralis]MDF3132079.1 transporter substrate-binding domain-containing protein [Pseudomonas extremaustralis]MDG2968043.1 transporter substrate-binding domain-containing protein [Pseudomonas extremaustralis]TWS0